jgi:hypothetical protein
MSFIGAFTKTEAFVKSCLYALEIGFRNLICQTDMHFSRIKASIAPLIGYQPT